MMKDTGAWIFQTWVAVILSASASLYGIFQLTGQNKLLMLISFFFCVSAAVSLQKMIRDNQREERDTTAYRMISWGSFLVSMSFMVYCVREVELEHWHRSQLVTSFLFVISSVFVLSKTIRDNQEYEQARLRELGKTLEKP
ncbi:MAG: hypothetical protein FJ138_08950 [Deltaproteobacteria bacterium]|nr:hypothetical protein [Deltaproteobacteria bacterium]